MQPETADSTFIHGANPEEDRVVLNIRPSVSNIAVELDKEYVKSLSCVLHTTQLVIVDTV